MALGTGLAPNVPVNCVVGSSASGPTSSISDVTCPHGPSMTEKKQGRLLLTRRFRVRVPGGPQAPVRLPGVVVTDWSQILADPSASACAQARSWITFSAAFAAFDGRRRTRARPADLSSLDARGSDEHETAAQPVAQPVERLANARSGRGHRCRQDVIPRRALPVPTLIGPSRPRGRLPSVVRRL
jgi:hypothetical protein